jgi:hypothetical protein
MKDGLKLIEDVRVKQHQEKRKFLEKGHTSKPY